MLQGGFMPEISELCMYFVTRLDSIHGLCLAYYVIFMITSTIAVCAVGCEDWDYTKHIKKIKAAVFGLVVCIVVSCLVPTTKEYYAIKLVPAIAQSETLEQLPPLAVKYLKQLVESEDN